VLSIVGALPLAVIAVCGTPSAEIARPAGAALPHVPVRQWVLTLPHRLRYLLAYNHALCRAVLGVAVRAVLGFYRRRARRTGVRDGRSGAVTVIQRFGGGLQLNVHFHTSCWTASSPREKTGASSSTPPSRRATRRWRGRSPPSTGASSVSSGRDRRGGPPAPPCGGRRSSDKSRVVCTRTVRGARTRSSRTEPARTLGRALHTSGTRGTRARRSGEVRRRRCGRRPRARRFPGSRARRDGGRCPPRPGADTWRRPPPTRQRGACRPRIGAQDGDPALDGPADRNLDLKRGVAGSIRPRHRR